MPVVQAFEADMPEPSPLATYVMPEKTPDSAADPEPSGGSGSINPIGEGFYPAAPAPSRAGSVLDQWPDAFRQSVLERLERLQAHPRALLVRIVWTSECPHAEVDLKGPQYVQHNHPRQSGSGELETTEWGMVVSPSTTHATVHLVRTHHDVSVRLQVIEWPSFHSREIQLDFTRPGHDGKQYWSQRRLVDLQHLMAGVQR
ncbi:MAG: hypothetical protein IT423_03660 [Pirellulaceae bacterium]|nr:hypothetical protein [Pirellulaceae bacterium]